MPPIARLTRFCPLLIAAILASPAHAQSETPAAEPPAQPSGDRPGFLSGPSVEIDALPGLERTFGGDTAMVPRMGGRSVPMREYLRILKTLETSKDPALVPARDQQARIRQTLAKFRTDMTAARQQAKPQAGDTDAPNQMDAPGSGDGARTPATPARQSRGSASEIQALVVDAQQAIWMQLTEPQQAHVAQELARLDEQMQADRLERELARLDKTDAKPDGEASRDQPRRPGQGRRDPLAGAIGPDGRVNLDALPERVRERIASLPEARQREAIERLRERLKNREPAGDQRRNRGRALPPPPIESVTIPEPD